MLEKYEIAVDGGAIAFAKTDAEIPAYALSPAFEPAKAPANVSLVCRMGSPDLAHCVIFREDGKPGGIFALHEQNGLLFAAIAKSNLAYALAKGHFGALVANARYGVDIFEHMGDEDD